MISQQKALIDATIGWQISAYGYLEDIYSTIIFSIKYSISCTLKLCLGIVLKIDRHNNDSNKIVIKPDKIFSLTGITVYQRDGVKSSWGN